MVVPCGFLFVGNPVALRRLVAVDANVREHLARAVYFSAADLLGVDLLGAEFGKCRVVGLVQDLRGEVLHLHLECADLAEVRWLHVGLARIPVGVGNNLHAPVNFCRVLGLLGWWIYFTQANAVHVGIVRPLLSTSSFNDDAEFFVLPILKWLMRWVGPVGARRNHLLYLEPLAVICKCLLEV